MDSMLRKFKPYYIRKAFRYLRHYGLHDFAVRVQERLAPEHVPYGPWFEKRRVSGEELAAQRREAEAYLRSGRMEQEPFFSVIVPIYRTPERYLQEMAHSVLSQSFPDFELILVNASPDDRSCSASLRALEKKDRRVRILALAENQGIAQNTNAGLFSARGEYVCFMDHDDRIEPDALYHAWKAIVSACGAGRKKPLLLYTDEDKIRDDGRGGEEHFQPHFKPDFNLDLLRSNNYICHFLIVKASIAREAGGFDSMYDGAQDYDFILRCTDLIRAQCGCGYGREAQPGIVHIPRVLSAWRVHEQSTADNPESKSYAYDAGRRALLAHLDRCGEKGDVAVSPDFGFYRIRYREEEHPLVSIIIPNHEQREVLQKCIGAIHAHTDYDRYEVIVVENNSSSREILSYYKSIQGIDHVRVVRWKGASFNFSSVCNKGAEQAHGNYLVFMNNDVEVKDGWLTELLSVCERPGVGAAGPKLFYPDGKVQSAGVVVGIGQVAGSLFTGMNGAFGGYLHKASLMQDLSAVTGALIMVQREIFEQVGGFRKELAVAFNDVDLCLRLREKGCLVVYDPFAQAIHHESVSRGDEYTKEKAERFRKEAAFMKAAWPDYYEKGDPFYNPNLSLKRWDYSLSDD